MPERTIVITVEITVNPYQDLSGLTPDELARVVNGYVEEERNELAMEAKICAIKLMGGDKLERTGSGEIVWED